ICSAYTPQAVAGHGTPTAAALSDASERWHAARARMIALQEELDWFCYRAYGVLTDDLLHSANALPPLALGERAFEIVLARRVANGEVESAWFERHRSTPITEIPAHWSAEYRRLVERRIALIESNRDLALLEQPEYKRRWSTDPWEERVQRALREWLLDRLESPDYRREPTVTSAARLAAQAKQD